MFRRIVLLIAAVTAVVASSLAGAVPASAEPLPATSVTAGRASLTVVWDPAAYPVGGAAVRTYEVTVTYTGAASGSVIQTVTGATTGSLRLGASPAYSYTASVRALDDASSAGTYAESTPAVIPTALAAPVITSAIGGNRQVALRWSAVTGASYYSVYRDGTKIVSSTARTYFTDTGSGSELVNGTSYSYVVRAHASVAAPSSVLDGPDSAARSATAATVPDRPTSVLEKTGNRQITVTWTAPVFDGGSPVTTYRIITKSGTALPTCTATSVSTCAAIPTGRYPRSPVRIVRNVGPEKPLSFAVQARNLKGWSATSAYGPATQPYTSLPPFALGTRGPVIIELQKRLTWAGLTVPVTGVFDLATKQQVKHLQEKFLYNQTGVVNDSTWKLLKRITADGAVLPTSCRGTSLCISKTQRLLRYVVNGKVVRSFDVRFGPEGTGFRTPVGVFSINWKDRVHTSSEYGSPMPMTMNFVGGVAVHYSYFFKDVGYWGNSHGCVNVRDWAGLEYVYNRASVGTRVVVYW